MTKAQNDACYEVKFALMRGIISMSNEKVLELTKKSDEIHEGCDGCKHIDDGFDEEPCKWCRYNYEDKWEAKE